MEQFIAGVSICLVVYASIASLYLVWCKQEFDMSKIMTCGIVFCLGMTLFFLSGVCAILTSRSLLLGVVFLLLTCVFCKGRREMKGVMW